MKGTAINRRAAAFCGGSSSPRALVALLLCVAIAIMAWLAFQQATLGRRIAALELGLKRERRTVATTAPQPAAAPGFGKPGAADAARPLDPAEMRRQIDEMRDAIQSLHSQLATSRQEITAVASQQAAVQAQAAVAAQAATRAFIDDLVVSQTPQRVPHYTGGPKRSWGHEQATGAPDTTEAGDLQTAWASKIPDGGVEWLELDYERPVNIDAIRVVESHNPGAISKVAVILPDGREETVWEGNLPASEQNELLESDFKVARAIQGNKVRVYVDTGRVPGWNEIDAVQLIGKDGSQQWAIGSTASSSYSDP